MVGGVAIHAGVVCNQNSCSSLVYHVESGSEFMWWLGLLCRPGLGFYECGFGLRSGFTWIRVLHRIGISVHVVDQHTITVRIEVLWV